MTTLREIVGRGESSGQVGCGKLRGQKDGPGGACHANPVLTLSSATTEGGLW